MADGMPKVDKVAKASLALIEGNNMGLDADALGDDVKEKGLSFRSGSDCSSRGGGG
ncbi:hypothetical protein AG1IA_04891 [Rhizoctonia solani AG-1 IA]|uniref:Uncharacterized protein n=1 Tax=Thanatephorus cucumeris (strain AG1-IA) TaxID=983506 RepID=L8WXJ1_THACA|nr:hypothetical protein AG1IA_04891 [Rhizoctonia solani AG-1 IA]